MIIREIKKKDYEQYSKLINSNISQKTFNKFVISVLNDKHKIYILEIDSKLIATGTILIEEKLTYGGCFMGHIENILVAEEYRGNGYGKLIIKKLIEYGEKYGCYRIDLNCESSLNKFYSSLGFNKYQTSMCILFPKNYS